MDIDEFLDKEAKETFEEAKPIEDKSKKIEAETKGLKLEHPDIIQEVKKYVKKDDYFNEINLALEKNDFGTAEKIYYGLWAKLIGNLLWDKDIYTDLVKIGGEMREALNEVYSEANKKKALAQDLLDKSKESIARGNHQAALNLYSELTDLHNEMPAFLYEEKRKMHNEILRLYMELKEKIDSIFLNNFNASLSRIKRMVNDTKSGLKNADSDNAKNIYLDIVKIYNNLPAGFLSEKISVAGDILELYKEISITLEIKELEGQLGIERIQKMQSAAEKFYKESFQMQKLKEISLQRKVGLAKSTKKPLEKAGKGVELKNLLIKRRMDMAKLKIGKGLYDDTRKDIESILRLDPDNAEAKNMLNMAVQSHLSGVGISPEKIWPAMIKKAEKPLASGQSPIKTDIDKHIEQLREMSMQRKIGLLKKPSYLAVNKPRVMAKDRETKAIELKNLLIKRRLEMAKIKVGKGLYDDAKKDIESILRLDPDNAEAKNITSRAVQR